MDGNQVGSIPLEGQQAQTIQKAITINQRNAPAPASTYRRAITCTLEPYPDIVNVKIDPQTTQLTGKFTKYTYNHKTSIDFSDYGSIEYTENDQNIIINLGVYRHLRSLWFNTNTYNGDQVQLFRMDGSAISTTPCTNATIYNQKATFSEDFLDTRFAIKIFSLQAESYYNDFSDVEQLITNIRVTAYPFTPRILISCNQNEPEPAWSLSGHIDYDANSNNGEIALIDELVNTVQSFIERNSENGQILETIDIILETDQPALFMITDLHLGYYYHQIWIPGEAKKQVLFFSDEQGWKQQIKIPLLTSSPLTHATLQITPIFSNKGISIPLQDLSNQGMQGALVTATEWTAQRKVLEEPTMVKGIRLCLYALHASSTVRIRLIKDIFGFPHGQIVEEHDIPLQTGVRPRWYSLFFHHDLLIPAESLWICMQCIDGKAIWSTQNGGEIGYFTTDDKGILVKLHSLDTSGAFEFLYTHAQKPFTDEQPMQVVCGSYPVINSSKKDQRIEYNITESLQQILQDLQESDEEMVNIDVTFQSSYNGRVTLYPLAIEYDKKQALTNLENIVWQMAL